MNINKIIRSEIFGIISGICLTLIFIRPDIEYIITNISNIVPSYANLKQNNPPKSKRITLQSL